MKDTYRNDASVSLEDTPRSSATPMIQRRTTSGPCGLSFSQERLWFMDQFEAQSALHNVPKAMRIRGALEKAALQQALNTVIARHEVLRTTFTSVDDRPIQVIATEARVELGFENYSGRPDAEQAAHAVIQSEARRPFALDRDAMLRAYLVRLAPDDHLLLINVHHIACDHRAMEVLMHELSESYAAHHAGRTPALPDLPIQYADFALWERDWLDKADLSHELEYWRKTLAGDPPPIELTLDHRRPPNQTFAGSRLSRESSREFADKIRRVSASLGTDVSTVLLAAFYAWLMRYTGQEDLTLGTASRRRRHAAAEPLIGFFVNVLVLRTDVGGNPKFSELIQRVRAVANGARDNQDLPFARLVEAVQPNRSSRAPLFQLMFEYGKEHILSIPGLDISEVEVDRGTSQFDLTLDIVDAPGCFRIGFEYCTDLFETATIDRMLRHFEEMLRGIVDDPQGHIQDFPMLGPGERRTILEDWNRMPARGGDPQCVHHEFEQQVLKSPDADAVRFEDQSLTYRELNVRANGLAEELLRRGAAPETLIGIFMERSLDVVVAVLGIWKAGAAYVPMDINYPEDRLKFMIEDTGMRTVLTDGRTHERLDGLGAERIRADEIRINQTNPASSVRPENLAYILFTSGSTGRSKGVGIEHRNLWHYVNEIRFRLELQDGWSYATVSTFSADLGNTVVFPSLVSGGCLHVIAEHRIAEAAALGDYFSRNPIDCMKIVPSHLAALLSSSEPERVLPRKLLVTGGEALRWNLVDEIQKLSPTLAISNHYGPTETTVGVLTYRVGATPVAGAPVTVPLGRPIGNTQIYILDTTGQPVPIGVAGEMYIAGKGVARSYWNRPELTEERFVPDRFSGAGQRMYRTGDRARYLADGCVEFLGRVDFQVKIRGYRVELGEIEEQLRHHGAVRDAVVTVREETPGDLRIVAYIVLGAASAAPTAAEWRAFLQQKLPDYMVPTAFVTLDALPLTPNGKIDRRALPSPEPAELGDQVQFVAPRTAVEEMLAGIWCDVLGMRQVSIHANFFELGGHSLVATQTVARLRKAFKVALPLKSIFDAPTIAKLSESIETARRKSQGLETPRVERADRTHPLELSFAQYRMWFLDQMEPGNPAYNHPFNFRATGTLDLAALRKSVNAIVSRHEVLRTTYTTQGGSPVQVIHPVVEVPFEVIELSHVPRGEQAAVEERLTLEEARKSFDISKDSMTRVTVLRFGAQKHSVLFNMPHIATDGWSTDVFYRELSAFYQAFTENRSANLPELKIQYADYAAWQRSWLKGETLDKQVRYWTEQLKGAPPLLKLPTDRPRPAIQTFPGAWEFSTIPKSLADDLRLMTRKEQATMFMTTLAAFQALLHLYSKQDDVVVAANSAGRTHVDIEELVGFFVNMLVLRASAVGDPTFREFLGRVREVSLGAFAHEDLPFDKLVEGLNPERNPSYSPVFQVVFGFHPEPVLKLPGLGVELFRVDPQSSKFDWTLDITDTNGDMIVYLEYNTDLFDRSTATRTLQHYQAILKAVVLNPDIRISGLQSVLSELDQQQRDSEKKEFADSAASKLLTIRRRTIRG